MQVMMRKGFVDSLEWMHDRWHINGSQLTADRAFLTTGSDPKGTSDFPDLAPISLDDALTPSRLAGMNAIFTSNAYLPAHAVCIFLAQASTRYQPTTACVQLSEAC